MKAPLCVPWVHPQKPCWCRTKREHGWKGRISFSRISNSFFSKGLRDLLDCAHVHPEKSQWVLATWFSSQGPCKGLEKASDAWELFTEGKVLSLWTPRIPFHWRRGLWLWMNHTTGQCKLQVLKAEVREQRFTPAIEVFIMKWQQLRWNYLWSGSESSFKAEDTQPLHLLPAEQLWSTTLELLGWLSHLFALFSLNELISETTLLVLLSWGDRPGTDGCQDRKLFPL